MSTQPQIWYAHGKSDNVTCMNRDTKWLDNATKPILIFETVQYTCIFFYTICSVIFVVVHE